MEPTLNELKQLKEKEGGSCNQEEDEAWLAEPKAGRVVGPYKGLKPETGQSTGSRMATRQCPLSPRPLISAGLYVIWAILSRCRIAVTLLCAQREEDDFTVPAFPHPCFLPHQRLTFLWNSKIEPRSHLTALMKHLPWAKPHCKHSTNIYLFKWALQKPQIILVRVLWEGVIRVWSSPSCVHNNLRDETIEPKQGFYVWWKMWVTFVDFPKLNPRVEALPSQTPADLPGEA